ncbi:MAG: DedA family protein [Epsilonproteobacteria bacterium]|nr:DedA family protein [Campylobacterota bacterium]
MEQMLVDWLKEYGYIVLFVWSMAEGETGLIMAGILSHTGDMNLPTAILVAGLGGFVGDQIWYYVGRYNKSYVHKEFKAHKRKFAKARLLLRKYGMWLIFVQRFLYGLRTIIPIAIGVSGYDNKKFAIVNFFSAFIWASLTIIPAYIFGEELLGVIKWAKAHWYISVMFLAIVFGGIWYYGKKMDK